jgi:UDP-N-acetylmuramyl pentapeptide phosphotransferase/UDP-N-acetylglucosamine-1-phosphate transferase
MFDFRFSVLNLIVSLLTSAISSLLIEQRWKASILLIGIGAVGIVILSVAIVIARRILSKWQRDQAIKKNHKRNKRHRHTNRRQKSKRQKSRRAA